MDAENFVESLWNEIREKCEEAQNLIINESKNDPVTERFKSKFKALDVFSDIESLIFERTEGLDKVPYRLNLILGIVYLEMGKICLETEERQCADEQFIKAIEVLKKDDISPQAVVTLINTYNNLGLLFCTSTSLEKSKDYLEMGDSIYASIIEQFPGIKNNEYTLDDVYKYFGVDSTTNPLEKAHTLTLYYLAQVYEKLDDLTKSAVCFYRTLRRQLEMNDYEPIDWVLNSATLSQYFMDMNMFPQCRRLLAASSYILNKYESELMSLEESEETEYKKGQFKSCTADIARCWAKYGLAVLTASKNKYKDGIKSPENILENSELNEIRFPTIELSVFEDQISVECVSTYQDAKAIVIVTQTHLAKAKEFFLPETHATEWAQVLRDTSHMYELLASFENNESRQCKLHKKRLRLLETVAKTLNPSRYLEISRQLWYDIGEIYVINLDYKKSYLKSTNEIPTAVAWQKISDLQDKAMHYLYKFIDSFKDKSTKKMTKKQVDANWEKVVITTHLYIAKLHSKFISQDVKEKIENMEKSIATYQIIVDYCSDEQSQKKFEEELGICRGFLFLLPIQLQRMKLSSEG